jgi:hypothetical protein
MGVGRVWRLAATLSTSMVWFDCFFFLFLFLVYFSCFVLVLEFIEAASMGDAKENLHYLIKTYSCWSPPSDQKKAWNEWSSVNILLHLKSICA